MQNFDDSKHFESLEERYREEDNKICIDVRVKNDIQLFDSRDPAPFIERDLDDDFVEYVLASVQCFSLRRELKLVVHISESVDENRLAELNRAIRSYFSYEALLHRKHLRRSVKNTYVFLLAGIALLLFCLMGSELASHSSAKFVRTILKEGLLIGGWVALWRPLESLLYDWWPISLKIRYFKKLSQTEISIRCSK